MYIEHVGTLSLLRKGRRERGTTLLELIAFIAIVGFSTTFGLMAGGFIALRPDHIFLISQLRSALRENRWVVVAHPVNREQAARAKSLLLQSQAEVHSTL